MIRTLIVDDDPDVVLMHRLFVEAIDGFEVAGTVDRGAEVLPFLESRAVDLVLLDVHLPDLGGLEVLAGLRAAGHAPGVIMITAASDRDTVGAAIGRGIDDYLVKPFTMGDFKRRLESFRAVREAAGRDDAGALGQAQIDRMLGAGRGTPAGPQSGAVPASTVPVAGAPSPLPKGYARPTLDLVSGALRGAGADLSAQEVAERCGISRVSARRYLDLMAERGLAELRPRYGSAGRPEHRYRWTGRG
ncbi:response regulator [Zafaria sp. J156]|uniref:response regulator n=1 Tax=Zafaria sp. J156 TaxID=3116490 RepID=UPI002E75F262|nr:response regulator [Zafaria sp. J156]MEE1621882.1 response regulator [Zafaria sp. J156]